MTAQTRAALGNKIKMLRKANNLSQQKLALMVSVERSYLAKLEHGKRNPSIDCIEKIAGGLGVTLSELFEGLENETEESIGKAGSKAGGDANRPHRIYAAVKFPPK